MKRIFALALAICMALSMMVLTASAASECHHNYLPSNCSRHVGHLYVREIRDDRVFYCRKLGNGNPFDDYAPKAGFEGNHDGISPKDGLLLGLYGDVGWEVCTPAQPKTGVMDTLPLWFGVMAVSACAYILTSKKKVF